MVSFMIVCVWVWRWIEFFSNSNELVELLAGTQFYFLEDGKGFKLVFPSRVKKIDDLKD